MIADCINELQESHPLTTDPPTNDAPNIYHLPTDPPTYYS